jgi:hypothetical protein
MLRLLVAILLAWPVLAANTRLYLTDGTYHVVREYEAKSDRVRYYSVERGEWEEIPLDLVDLKRTKAEAAERVAEIKEEKSALEAEDKAERAMRKEIANVPYEPGAYVVTGDEIRTLKQAEADVVTNKRRSLLKRITPIPIVTGKSTVEIKGENSEFIVAKDRPEFYFRLASDERFAMVKLSAQKGARIVERWTTIPVTNEIVQEHDEVKTFRHQVQDNLYKIWPQTPLEPGEYALIEYTEGKANTQIWDFAYRTGGAPPPKAPAKK